MMGRIEGIKIYVNDETYTKYKKTLEDEIDELQQENQQLKDNWNKLWQYILEKDKRGYEKVYTDDILDEMQEIGGSDK